MQVYSIPLRFQSIRRRLMHLRQMLFLDRWISHTPVFIVALFFFYGNERLFIKEIKESDISGVSLSDKVCFLKSTDSSLLKFRINSTALFWIVNLPRLITMLVECKEDVLHLKGFQNKPWQPALHIKWRD